MLPGFNVIFIYGADDAYRRLTLVGCNAKEDKTKPHLAIDYIKLSAATTNDTSSGTNN